MPGYFNTFPTITYANNQVTNLITKAKFDQSVQRNLAVYYSYNIVEGERADQLAERFYGDPTLDWIIYLSNDIIDPYHDWPLTYNQFNSFIISKYGSIERSTQKIAFYRNNYYTDNQQIMPNVYSVLPAERKKYFSPVFGINNSIVSYKRRETDTIVETLSVVSLTVDSISGFIIGEKVIQNNNSGYITYIGSNYLIINKITGNFVIGTITGEDSKTVSTLTDSSIISQPVPLSESVYFTPISYYTYEDEINQSKFNIRVLDRLYVGKVVQDISELFA